MEGESGDGGREGSAVNGCFIREVKRERARVSGGSGVRWEACERGMWSERRCYYGRMLSFFPLSGLWGGAAAEEEEGEEAVVEEQMGLMGCLVQKTEESEREFLKI